jgi:hypothetical protein
MPGYIKTAANWMAGTKKKTGKLTEEEKRVLFQNTVEKLYATEQSWRTLLLSMDWQSRIYLIQQKPKIEKVL